MGGGAPLKLSSRTISLTNYARIRGSYNRIFLCLYSRRLPWSFFPNPLARLVQEKRRASGTLLDLTISNPTEVLPQYPHTRISEAYASIHDFTYNPHPLGSEAARNEIVRLYREHEIALTTDRIALTASSSEAYAMLFKLLCNPGDEVLVPVPSYPLFEYLAALECVRAVPYRLAYDGNWFIDFASLRDNLSPQSRAIIVVNPNNPTGSFLKAAELIDLLDLARERDMTIISDEVFMDYSFGNHPHRVLTLAGQDSTLIFCLNGLSKMAAMPQMKLGWIVISGPAEDTRAACEHLELLLDTYLSVNSPVQAALPALLSIGADNRLALKQTIDANRRTLNSMLADQPVQALHTEGGWSAILQLPCIDSEEVWIMSLLQEQNVLVQPGYFFDMASEPYAVISLITPEDIFAEGIRRIGRLAGTN